MINLGVLSDTHIPERARELRPWILPLFRDVGVDAILHAGDICAPWVLDQLGQVAPVYAVQGNRDFALLRHLPLTLEMEFGGIKIGMLHGHGGFESYMADKLYIMVYGVRESRYVRRALATFPQAQVIVFGHTHQALNTWLEGRLIFNPGLACGPSKRHPTPTVGLLRIFEGGVEGEIVEKG